MLMLFAPAARLHTAVLPFDQAAAYVDAYHRHNAAPVGHVFSVGCYFDGALVGVAMCGRPVARKLDNGARLEVYRVCTRGHQDACSKLYGACQQTARVRGFEQLITYTLHSETAASVRAANFVLAKARAGARCWSGKRQARRASGQTSQELKRRWEFDLHPTRQVPAALAERDLYEPLVQEPEKAGAAFDYIVYPGRAYMHQPGLPVPAYEPTQLGTRTRPTPEQLRDLHELAYAADQAGFQLILARLNPGFPIYLTTCRRGTAHRQSIQWCDTHISARERLSVYFGLLADRT